MNGAGGVLFFVISLLLPPAKFSVLHLRGEGFVGLIYFHVGLEDVCCRVPPP